MKPSHLFSLILTLSFLTTLTSLAYAEGTSTTVAKPDGVQWLGDFHYRHESRSVENVVPSASHRHRIVGRFGLLAPVNDDTTAEIRLATGVGANSDNQTLGSGNDYANYTIKLDRAFFEYHLEDSPNTHVLGGRMKNVFWAAGTSDLVFSSDLNFDGLAVTSEYKHSDTLSVFSNLGGFWVLQQDASISGKDNFQISPQLGIKTRLPVMIVNASVAQHFFTHTQGSTVGSAGSSTQGAAAFGNSVTTATNSSGVTKVVYAKDYHVWDLGLELGTRIVKPFALFFNYVSNAAVSTEKDGYIYGVRIGKLGEVGDWGVAYDYRRLKSDAVLGYYADAFSGGGGTNISSHRFRGGVQVSKNVVTGLAVVLGKTLVSTTPLRRNIVIADLGFTF